jgi:hypothetical protein
MHSDLAEQCAYDVDKIDRAEILYLFSIYFLSQQRHIGLVY